MHRFKSAILEKLKNCQNGTFEPVHEIQNFFWPKVFFWSIMKVPFRKNIHNMPQGPPNPGFMQEKVQKGDFLKKPSWELKFFCCFRFLWISWRFTMRTNLPKTLDQLIFGKYTLNLSKFTKYLVNVLKFTKYSQNQLNIRKFLPPKRRKTLRPY